VGKNAHPTTTNLKNNLLLQSHHAGTPPNSGMAIVKSSLFL
jgi:hypothetical protein